jgi:hypothetical protein
MKGPNTLMGIIVFQVLTHSSFVFFLCGHSVMFFVEMLGQLKCVSYYSEGSGIFCNDEGTPSIMHGIDPVNEGGNYIERYFHY